MKTFEFIAVLDRVPVDEDFDRLFEAGLDDAIPETRAGRGMLSVEREAETLPAAVLSVAADAERAGFEVVAIEEEDLVSLKTIASRLGRTYESVRMLSTGKRGPGGFPAPLSGDGWALYSWSAVAEWARTALGADLPDTAGSEGRLAAALSFYLRARVLIGTDELTQIARAGADALAARPVVQVA